VIAGGGVTKTSFPMPAARERMQLEMPREKSAGFRRICPELSAFESVD